MNTWNPDKVRNTIATYCVRGCTRKLADKTTIPERADVGKLCRGCYRRLERWLIEIPDRFALLPNFILPTTDVEKNPDASSVKRQHAPAPVKVGALDLLDNRRGRKWLGTEPTEDRRGAVGTLHAIADYIRAGRNTSTRLKPTVSREADTIYKNLEWLAGDDLIADAYDELRKLHRELGDAIGEFPPRPVGTCTQEDGDETCGGALMPTYSGVRCAECGTSWDQATLRMLGRVLQDAEVADDAEESA